MGFCMNRRRGLSLSRQGISGERDEGQDGEQAKGRAHDVIWPRPAEADKLKAHHLQRPIFVVLRFPAVSPTCAAHFARGRGAARGDIPACTVPRDQPILLTARARFDRKKEKTIMALPEFSMRTLLEAGAHF
ncbi:MAG: hypothetical protein J0I52_15000, partial [Bordetella sp.]|nr:hypothetical protein [Bordetella sp.]